MEWKEAKLFVSSTFNDMHAERDYLISEVFPELREWCEKRRIRLSDIDLRWGVTKEDAESGSTVSTCLNCIDECRPFFICFLGQRRGWVPGVGKDIDPADFESYEWLRDSIGSSSITEMEIEHATLAPMVNIMAPVERLPDSDRALFFFRNDPFGEVLTDEQRLIYTNAAAVDEALEDRRLAESKAYIRSKWKVYDYDCVWDPDGITSELKQLGDASKGSITGFSYDGRPLKDTILDTLKLHISEVFPENTPISVADPFEEDLLEQQLFAQVSSLDFVGRRDEIREVMTYLRGPGGEALFVIGNTGIGKTTLLARICVGIRDAGGKSMLYRSCGVTEKSGSENDLWLSLAVEAGIIDAAEAANGTDHRISESFFRSLMDAGYNILILDAIDKLPAGLPIREIPEGFHLVISSDNLWVSEEFDFPIRFMEMSTLTTPEKRTAVVDSLLKRSLKKLDKNDMETIISSKGSASPLYLKIVVNELKSFGSFMDLHDKILRFGETPTDAFRELIRTVDEEFSDVRGMAASVIGMLTLADSGLSEDEIMVGLAALGVESAELLTRLRMFIRRIRPYLLRSSGRYAIDSRCLRDAFTKNPLSGEHQQLHKTLALVYLTNLENAEPPKPNEWNDIHGSKELLYQLSRAEDYAGILDALTDERIFCNIYPCAYDCRYYNGIYFGKDESRLGCRFSVPQDRQREIAFLFLDKAKDCLNRLNSEFPHPYARHAQRLKESGDMDSFFRYRDCIYHAIEFCDVAALFMWRGLCGVDDDVRHYYSHEFMSCDGGVYSFLEYLSNFGGDETGLSYKIEDRAAEVLGEFYTKHIKENA